MNALDIGIAGGGIGGLAAAIALQRSGYRVTVYEQAPHWMRVGADVNLTPNVVRALDGFKRPLSERIRRDGAQPTFRISRDWDTSLETSRLGMGNVAQEQYGAPQVTIHRADLLAALAAEVPDDTVVGADGIHSRVRAALFGEESPRFTGVVSYRSVVPTERVRDVPEIEAFTKWWGPTPDVQIVTFPLSQGRETFVFATTGQPSWTEESWTTAGDVNELREVYRDFHPDARKLLQACDSVMKSALYEREPLARWSVGRVTLLGDACHPMLPFMAQGAGMAIEDAVVLGRALAPLATLGDNAPGASIEAALTRYENARRERTARIQIGSRGNQWMRGPGNADWVYGYDAWHTDLE
jgi:salicylate hydroxylase